MASAEREPPEEEEAGEKDEGASSRQTRTHGKQRAGRNVRSLSAAAVTRYNYRPTVAANWPATTRTPRNDGDDFTTADDEHPLGEPPPPTAASTSFKQNADVRSNTLAVPPSSAVAPIRVGSSIRRKISTCADLDSKVFWKEGYLLKKRQGAAFQRWKRRYFRLKGRKLYYAHCPQAEIFNEIDLIELSVAECGTKNWLFQVITPFSVLVLSAISRKEMEEWMVAMKAAANLESFDSCVEQYESATSGQHTWYVSSHARPAFCNICREALSGVTWNGLTCEVCKIKSHKRCSVKCRTPCKWTTLDSIPSDLLTVGDDGLTVMRHQWLEGNLTMGSRCAACQRACGSIIRLQDWRCLWCALTVHTHCLPTFPDKCQLGSARLSVLPPIAIRCLNSDGVPQLSSSPVRKRDFGGSPLLVLVNSKSGDTQGMRVLRRFKRLLNPVQVFDLICGGPDFGLQFFKIFPSFRVLVCGGDGSVGWVLSALDRLNLHAKCQLGVLPLGTGNDLARTLGWGHSFEDDTQLPQVLERFEMAHTRMLDRWSVLTYEATAAAAPAPPPSLAIGKLSLPKGQITKYEDSVASHLSKILTSDDHSVVISSAGVLCETVKDFLSRVHTTYEVDSEDEPSDEPISKKCDVLQQKLDSLLSTLRQESRRADVFFSTESGIEPEGSDSDSVPELIGTTPQRAPNRIRHRQQQFVQREALMSRANSLKKAIRLIIEHAEKAVDEQNWQTETVRSQLPQRKRSSRRSRRSKTLPAEPPAVLPQEDAKLQRSDSSAAAAADVSAPSSVSPPEPRRQCPTITIVPRLATPEPSLSTNESSVTSGLGATAAESDCGVLNRKAISHLPPPPLRIHPPTPILTPSSHEASTTFADSTDNKTQPRKHSLTVALPPSVFGDYSGGGTVFSGRCHGRRRRSRRVHGGHMNNSATDGNCSDSAAAPYLSVDDDECEPPLSASAIVGGRQSSSVSRSPCSPFAKPKFSYSDSSIYDLVEAAAAINPSRAGCVVADIECGVKEGDGVTAKRKISRVSTFRSVEKPKAPSPHPGFMPAFRRGLIASGLTGGSLIAEVLLLNADVLGVAASPLMDFDEVPIDRYEETKVMNNYFGIGLDAKISLEFHQKREDYADKARSRSKLFMWYGSLAGKELLHRTYKNLAQRVHLECDGHRIQLPSLQGIVILNIPSYQGGAKFWGSSKNDGIFRAQSFDDRILEVVAVFGILHCATSRVHPKVVRLQNHRIAQCRRVKIVITGDESIPVQVDGEPWLQPPGYIQIVHKNRAQVLVRNPQFEATLKEWAEQQQKDRPSTSTSSTVPPPQELLVPPCDNLLHMFSYADAVAICAFVDSAYNYLKCVKGKLAERPRQVDDSALMESLTETTIIVERLYPPDTKLSELTHVQFDVTEAMTALRQVMAEVDACFPLSSSRQHSSSPLRSPSPDPTRQLDDAYRTLCTQLRRVQRIVSLSRSQTSLTDRPAVSSSPEVGRSSLAVRPHLFPISPQHHQPLHQRSVGDSTRSSKVARWLRAKWAGGRRRFSRSAGTIRDRDNRSFPSSVDQNYENVLFWTTEDVSVWLDLVHLGEHKHSFVQHEISGRELIRLERNDLKDLGMVKVGHIKRFQSAVAELNKLACGSSFERSTTTAAEESGSSLGPDASLFHLS